MNQKFTASDYLFSPEKRAFDFSVALSMGSLAVIGGLGIARYLNRGEYSGLFHQKRVGKGGKLFEILKVRTLADDGTPLPHAQLVRDIGLDETAQFINVIKGDMSVVGYRPSMVSSLNHAAQRLNDHLGDSSPSSPKRWLELREQVRPGIIGPSQLMEPRLDEGSISHLMDVVRDECNYLENATFSEDLKYLYRIPHILINGHNRTV